MCQILLRFNAYPIPVLCIFNDNNHLCLQSTTTQKNYESRGIGVAKELYLAGCIFCSVIVLLYSVNYSFAHARKTFENSTKWIKETLASLDNPCSSLAHNSLIYRGAVISTGTQFPSKLSRRIDHSWPWFLILICLLLNLWLPCTVIFLLNIYNFLDLCFQFLYDPGLICKPCQTKGI